MQESGNFVQAPEALPDDYELLQGGYPRIIKKGDVYVVEHDYLPQGERMQVPTRNDPLQSTLIRYLVEGTVKEFRNALLRKHHGEPCENVSRMNGGKGMYERN